MDDDEADRLDMPLITVKLPTRLSAVISKPGKVVVEIPAWNRTMCRKNTRAVSSFWFLVLKLETRNWTDSRSHACRKN